MTAPTEPDTRAGLFKTGEIIKRSGISRQVLYQYTTMGLIDEADRTEHGHRLFAPGVLKRLHMIRELNATGYPLKDIKEIFFSRPDIIESGDFSSLPKPKLS